MIRLIHRGSIHRGSIHHGLIYLGLMYLISLQVPIRHTLTRSAAGLSTDMKDSCFECISEIVIIIERA